MEYSEREFFVYKLLCNYVIVNINNIQLKVYHPSNTILYESAIIQNEIKKECIQHNVPSTNDMLDFMTGIGVWNYKKDKEIDILTKDIDELKIKIYQSFLLDREVNKYRSILRNTEKKLNDLLLEKSMFDSYTIEGISEYAKSQYIIEKCTKVDGKIYDWSSISIPMVFMKLQLERISDKTLRFISHNDPWSTLYSTSKKLGKIFNFKNISQEQRRLISWSLMYDNIQKSHECPHQSVIDDDDMIDGWLILQRREIEQKQKQKRMESNISKKIATSDEIFFVVDSKEAAQKVYDMNSNEAKRVIENRKRKIKSSKTDIKYTDFEDVKIDILNKISEGRKK